jgi:flavodoxin
MHHMLNETTNANGFRALTLYWSATGNTEKVANAIHTALERQQISAEILNVEQARSIDLYDYSLVFFGSPVYMWQPADPVQQFIKASMKLHNKQGNIKLRAPRIPGKQAVVFCTYSGPHTGVREAIPVCKYLAQFFEHLGFAVLEEWPIIGEFHGHEERSTKGMLGDIKGRPNAQDLHNIENDVWRLVNSLPAK